MKKFLAIFLALVTVTAILLTACNKKKENNDDEFDDTDPFANQYLNNSNIGTGTSTDTSYVPGNNDNVIFGTWVTKNDTVYVCHPTYLRYSTSNGDKSSQSVEFGASLTRIATNGTWDKVSYNDAEYYVYSYLVTPNKGDVTFTAITEDNVTSVINNDTTGSNPTQLNLRTTPCYDDDLDNLGASALTKTMTTAEGVEFKVIGINETKTWAKVYFKGKDARGLDIDGEFYCRPSYLEYFKTTDSGNGTGGVNPV
ncbi:MAG: hypothetical protein E7668_02150 [Ruminococcaceae bacterium]|nr:hypothetical protein [Oscillospiraceae bacterium]